MDVVKWGRTGPVLLVLFAVLTLGPAMPAAAHNYLATPKPGEEAIIPEIVVSRAAYRVLAESGEVDRYRFDARAGTPVYIQMTIPRIARFADFAPTFVVVSDATDFANVSIARVADGIVRIDDPEIREHLRLDASQHFLSVDSDGSAPTPFHEPFTGTDYWERQSILFTAPATGRYEIEVFDHEGKLGKYVLATGREERFGWSDIVALPRVRAVVRAFMEVGNRGSAVEEATRPRVDLPHNIRR